MLRIPKCDSGELHCASLLHTIFGAASFPNVSLFLRDKRAQRTKGRGLSARFSPFTLGRSRREILVSLGRAAHTQRSKWWLFLNGLACERQIVVFSSETSIGTYDFFI